VTSGPLRAAPATAAREPGIRRTAWRRWRDFVEYGGGALWLLPTVAGLVALVIGWILSSIDVGDTGAFGWVVFEGTPDDARTLLTVVATAMIGVIATVFGLAVVAIQLSSTQFSPRLVRNFLRDGVTQWVLAIFVGTFAYAAAGLYTVGLGAGGRIDRFPRLAVSGAMLLLFVSVAAVIAFADHLAHSLQVDSILAVSTRETLRAIEAAREGTDEPPPVRPDHAVPVRATKSGYLQVFTPGHLLGYVEEQGLTVALLPRLGDYVVSGTPVAHVWTTDPSRGLPDGDELSSVVATAVDLGFERTLQQDVGFGIRQLVDTACKALSPAVNDPYTAVQAVHHLSDILVSLAARTLGSVVIHRSDGTLVVPARRFADYLASAVGPIRRYGAAEPTVVVALLTLMSMSAGHTELTRRRAEAIRGEAALLLEDAERRTENPADLRTVHVAYAELERALAAGPPD
jgi:uncharacterized membrane protein